MKLIEKIKTLIACIFAAFTKKKKTTVAFTYNTIAIYKDDEKFISDESSIIFAEWESIVMQHAGMPRKKSIDQFKKGKYTLVSDDVDIIETIDLK